ncbi:MAG: DUF4440 domain-containing protein [Chitinophagaceae bacterium]|nr:DUF4440 domain-containing protein [Chitinophagaceae bacterium]
MLKYSLFAAAILNLLLVLSGCNNCSDPATATGTESKSFNPDQARKQIDEANREFMDRFNKSDSVGLADMFTADGRSMEPNEPSFTGREEIRTHYSIVMNAGANKLGLETTGLWGSEDMLAEEGIFTFMDKDNRQIDKGKYIVLWKKEESKWKLFRDCYNSDLPVQAPTKHTP